MIRGRLQPFSPVLAGTVQSVAYAVTRKSDCISICYGVNGALSELVLPEAAPGKTGERCDGLWRHSCFELFVKDGSLESESYLECNFAPSGDWNIYKLSGYREGLSPVTQATRPALRSWGAENSFSLEVEINSREVMSHNGPFYIGISCVIEDVRGNFSYWALSHHGDKPDFHDERSFEIFL